MSIDDVNRQHMEAMGLDPESLGKPTEKDEQCISRHLTSSRGLRVRCDLPRGHDDSHRYEDNTGGLWIWPNTFKQREGDQPLPVVNDHPDIQAAVIADIEARREVGIQRYGTALQPLNGRDMLLDAYEESLDLAIYLKGELVERALKAAAEAARFAAEAAQDDV